MKREHEMFTNPLKQLHTSVSHFCCQTTASNKSVSIIQIFSVWPRPHEEGKQEAGSRGDGQTERRRTDLEQTGGELLQLLAELVSDFRQPLTLLILQQQLLPHTHTQPKNNTTEKQPPNEHMKGKS